MKQAFVIGWLSGLPFFLSVSFFLVSLTKWAGAYAILGWILLSCLEALSFGLFAVSAFFIHNLRPNSLSSMLLIPAAWVVFEFLRSIGPWAFAWGVLGYTTHFFLPLAQLANLIGVFGLSFIILLINYSLVLIILNRKNLRRMLKPFLVTLIILIVILGFGFFRLNKTTVSVKQNVSIIQPNISLEKKFGLVNSITNISFLNKLTIKASAKNSSLVIWPESILPGYFDVYSDNLVNQRNPILLGSLRQSKGRVYNSAFFVNGRVFQKPYDKIYLVPFGETLPISWISNVVKPLRQSLTSGTTLQLFKNQGHQLGVLICSESSNQGLARAVTQKGAELLITITNDNWFGRSSLAHQHFEIGAFRAIENDRYFIQSANSGISGATNNKGELIAKSKLFQRSYLKAKVKYIKESSFFVSLGYFFPYLCLVICIANCLISNFAK